MDGTESFFRLQHGLITYAQAQSVGLTQRQVGWRLKQGEWKQVHPCVYRSTLFKRTWEQSAMAAVLWAGPNAVLSGASAARLMGLDAFKDAHKVHVTSGRRPHSRRGVILHRGWVEKSETETFNLIRS